MNEGPAGDIPRGVVRGSEGVIRNVVLCTRRDSGGEGDDKAVSFVSRLLGKNKEKTVK